MTAHLDVLQNGVEYWNAWRDQNPGIHPDLSNSHLSDTPMPWAKSRIGQADFAGINFNNTNLAGAVLMGANLRNAKLRNANLRGANLRRADLRGSDLTGALLNHANLTLANLGNAELARAHFWETVIARVNLTGAQGLEKCRHGGPSIVDQRTIRKSADLPEIFLRGCGLSDGLISFYRSLHAQPIQFYTCFISYSSKDQVFAERLHADLQQSGVRCWFAPNDLRIGDDIWDSIDKAIRVREKVLLILSEHSVKSHWVKDETKTAFAEERSRPGPVLFPIRLDDSVLAHDAAWLTKIREHRYIGDFTNWTDPAAYAAEFERLLRDLRNTESE